jgi:hypothetical protein
VRGGGGCGVEVKRTHDGIEVGRRSLPRRRTWRRRPPWAAGAAAASADAGGSEGCAREEGSARARAGEGSRGTATTTKRSASARLRRLAVVFGNGHARTGARIDPTIGWGFADRGRHAARVASIAVASVLANLFGAERTQQVRRDRGCSGWHMTGE